MNGCLPRPYPAETCPPALLRGVALEKEDRSVRDRQAAALYLKAAHTTENPAAREVLRRRAAHLLSPGLASPQPVC